jgi:hypothetical protein
MLTTKKSLIIMTLSIYTISTVLVSGLLILNYIPLGNIIYSQIFYQQALGQSTVTQTSADSSPVNGTKDESNNPLYREGLILSSKSGPNETSQVALLLPHRDDGKIYSGVLTYSASSPVEIGFLSRINIDNSTLSQITERFGESSPNWIDPASSIHNLTNSTTQIIGGIQPDYGSSTPYYSASVPFVASSVGLWYPEDKPFLVSYQLSANLVQPEIVNKIDFNGTK